VATTRLTVFDTEVAGIGSPSARVGAEPAGNRNERTFGL
jgi:hypothetical protein